MFILGMMCVFIGISLLAPDESKGIIINTKLFYGFTIYRGIQRLICNLF